MLVSWSIGNHTESAGVCFAETTDKDSHCLATAAPLAADYFPRKKNPSSSVIDHASQVGRPWLH